MQQIFTERMSCITHEVYTGTGCMWSVGCLVCLQPACLPSYPPAVKRQCPPSLADRETGLKWALVSTELCQLEDVSLFQKSLGALQGLEAHNWKLCSSCAPLAPSAWRRNLPENAVLGNSWKQTPERRCILVKRKPRKHLHRCGWHRRSWSHFICHCLILAEIITDIWLSKYEVNRKVSSYMRYYK